MVHLTRLNHVPVVLNADLIETIEATPDTVISLTTGQKLMVLEAAEEVVRRVLDFRRAIHGGPPAASLGPSVGEPALSPGTCGEAHGRKNNAA
jgi:flagellar protein FlbD